MRGWVWSSVRRFKQQTSKYILTSPLCNYATRRMTSSKSSRASPKGQGRAVRNRRQSYRTEMVTPGWLSELPERTTIGLAPMGMTPAGTRKLIWPGPE